MDNQREVNIELIKGTLDDYIVKDKDKIVIGRFTITELDKENKKCNLKLKFYREDNYDLLKITLKDILKAVFKIKIEDRIRIMPRILAVVRDSPKIKMPIAAATSGSKVARIDA